MTQQTWRKEWGWKPPVHPRMDDIKKAQPPMKTLKGIGNGTERKHGYGRGA